MQRPAAAQSATGANKPIVEGLVKVEAAASFLVLLFIHPLSPIGGNLFAVSISPFSAVSIEFLSVLFAILASVLQNLLAMPFAVSLLLK